MPEHENRQHSKPDPHGPGCCSDAECSTGLRNNYFVGKHLTPDAFRVEQKYLIERRQLLNRAIHGWGVVYGYAVTLADEASGTIKIGPGLALDRVGRELVHADPLTGVLAEVILLDEKGTLANRKDVPPKWDKEQCYMLRVHYAERQVGPQTLPDSCSCERHEWDQVCETVRFSLQPLDCSKCCEQPECELECECGKGLCCDDRRGEEEPTGNPVARGGCRCLCDHLTGFSPAFECTAFEPIEEPCGRVGVDLRNGVPLACVHVTPCDSDTWKFDPRIESCGPRRLVKRNDVLFDLIRGCDLTRISEIGWRKFHRSESVRWQDFVDSWGDVQGGKSDTLYWVRFSRPVLKKTVLPDCFAITVVAGEQEGGWGHMLRVPITEVRTEPAPDGSADLVIQAMVIVNSDWVKDAILSKMNLFNYHDALVEVEVRGDFIIDCNGQAVDAEPVGLASAPTGDGAPGGRYLSSFRVAARSPRTAEAPGQTQGGQS